MQSFLATLIFTLMSLAKLVSADCDACANIHLESHEGIDDEYPRLTHFNHNFYFKV